MPDATPGDDPADALLAYLRGVLDRPQLAYLDPPVAITGGFETRIFAFRLAGAPDGFRGRLIVRIFPEAASAGRALSESAVQNTLAGTGYPVPRVLHTCTDAGILGGVFTVMRFVEGRTLLDATLAPSPMLWRMAALLAQAHLQLHAIDPQPVMEALARAGVAAETGVSVGRSKRLRDTLAAEGLEGMLPGLEWLDANIPAAAPGPPSVLHMDFHPVNVLVHDGAVTGVIDWPNTRFGDPAADVGTTMVIMTMGPVDVPRVAKWPVDWLRRWLAQRYLAAYRRERPIAEASLRYYEALRCYRAMLEVARNRLARARGEQVANPGYAWDGPEQVALMTALFARVSGVPLVLPPAAGGR
jgi:aminoglycoside phosphotransferase (APT) family kinase protein